MVTYSQQYFLEKQKMGKAIAPTEFKEPVITPLKTYPQVVTPQMIEQMTGVPQTILTKENILDVYGSVSNTNVVKNTNTVVRKKVAKPTVPTVTPAPVTPVTPAPEWTHKLVLGFIRTPWAVEANVKGAVSSILVPLVNPFICVLGFDYVRHEVDWAASTVSIYYRKRASPAIPLVAILAAVAVCVLVAGAVIVSLVWLEAQKIQQQERTELSTLLEQGKISEDTYKQLTQGVAAGGVPTGLETVTGLIPLVILGGIAIAVLGIVPRRRD